MKNESTFDGETLSIFISVKKKLLLITYYWPPAGGVAVLRWLKYAALLSRTYDITVYIPENADYPNIDPVLEKEVPDNIRVLRGKILEPYGLFRKLSFKGKNYHPKQEFASQKKKSLLEKLAVFIRGNFFIPDARMLWIKPSIKRLKKEIATNDYDLIITNGTPHSVHLIGLGLKKTFKNIPWIADFRDPWTKVDYFDDLYLTRWGRKRHQKLEKAVLTSADLVTTVSKTWAEDFIALGAKSVDYIYNGYDERDFENISAQADEDKFVISHIGSLNSSRNHDSFWAGMAKFIALSEERFDKPIEIRLVGSLAPEVNDSIRKHKLDQYVVKVGVVSHEQSLIEMLMASVLVLLTGDQKDLGRIPAKVFEYFAAGKPILAYVSDNCEVYNLLQGFNSSLALNPMTELLFQSNQKSNRLKGNKSTFEASQFTKENLVHKIITNIENLITEND